VSSAFHGGFRAAGRGVRGRERRSEATGTTNRPFECGGKTRTQTTHSGGMTKGKNSERVKGLRAPSLALAYEDWTSPQAASPIDKMHCYFKEGFEILTARHLCSDEQIYWCIWHVDNNSTHAVQNGKEATQRRRCQTLGPPAHANGGGCCSGVSITESCDEDRSTAQQVDRELARRGR